MEKTNLLVANWKLNGDTILVNKLLLNFTKNHKISDYCKTVILPPYPYLSFFKDYLNSNKDNNLFYIGSQNVSEYDSGNYTGEISSSMLQDLGVRYCLVGHYERRRLFGENLTTIIRKTTNLIRYNITPIICFGEQKKLMPNDEIVNEILKITDSNDINKLIFAYEPIWAIGTNDSADHEYIDKYISNINKELYKKGITINNKKWLYGGSVTYNNAKTILDKTKILGLLLGRASLDLKQFFNILESISNYN